MSTIPDEIRQKLFNLNSCNETIKKLRKRISSSHNDNEIKYISQKLDNYLHGRKKIIFELRRIGYDLPTPGRPKKEENEKYKAIHIRKSFYLIPTNNENLEHLKLNGTIDNYSEFINQVLSSYFLKYSEL